MGRDTKMYVNGMGCDSVERIKMAREMERLWTFVFSTCINFLTSRKARKFCRKTLNQVGPAVALFRASRRANKLE
jgi:biotin synthase-like enzyme